MYTDHSSALSSCAEADVSGVRTASSGVREAASNAASSGVKSGASEPQNTGTSDNGFVISRFPLSASDVNDDLARYQEAREQRFRRRDRASIWLIGEARERAGLPRDTPPGRGKISATDADWVRPARPARCRWRVASAVGVHLRDEDDAFPRAHYSGTMKCASISACPPCSAVIRNKRAQEISKALNYAQHELGYSCIFVTLTLRHQWGDALAFTLDVLLSGFRKLQSQTGYRNLMKRYGIVGFIRSCETTLSADFGVGFGGSNSRKIRANWHPHFHLAYTGTQKLSVQNVQAFEHELGAMWIAMCKKLGAGVPNEKHGVKAVLVTGKKGSHLIGNYLSKLQDGADGEKLSSLGMELARGDLKKGRRSSITPFQLLDIENGPGSEIARTLFLEAYYALKGRKIFHWSKGLRDLLLPEEEEVTDEEIIEDAEQAELVLVLSARHYDTTFRDDPAALAGALELTELGLASLIHQEYPEPELPPPPQGQASGQSTA